MVPFVQNAIGMWVNETVLAEAGWDRAPATWAEFEQACVDVAASTEVGCYPFVESVSTFNAWVYSRGGQLLDEAGRQALDDGGHAQPAGHPKIPITHLGIEVGELIRRSLQGRLHRLGKGQRVFRGKDILHGIDLR